MNELQRWTPTLEMNTNTKITKGPRTTRQTDGRTDEYIILPLMGFNYVACGLMSCAQLWVAYFDRQILMRMTVKRDRETDVRMVI